MKRDEFIKIMRALDNITKEEFVEIINKHYKDDDYSDKVWQEFRRHRFGFTVSRDPEEPGWDLIDFAIKKSEATLGVDGAIKCNICNKPLLHGDNWMQEKGDYYHYECKLSLRLSKRK